jgi:mono/diheme cytochrome c family protein
MRYFFGFVAALILTVIVGAGVIATGAYSVAASDAHADFTHWLLETVKDRSITVRATAGNAPGSFTAEQIKSGFTEYDEMCVICHSAPGKEPSAVGKGLNPHPPDLSKAVGKWSNAELFWILRNGIKMTGMPAFGSTHSDETLWSIVAFLKQLPGYSAADYEAMSQAESRQEHESGGEHNGHHQH